VNKPTKSALPNQHRYIIFLHKHDGINVVTTVLLCERVANEGWRTGYLNSRETDSTNAVLRNSVHQCVACRCVDSEAYQQKRKEWERYRDSFPVYLLFSLFSLMQSIQEWVLCGGE
jgi:hypothetical protein